MIRLALTATLAAALVLCGCSDSHDPTTDDHVDAPGEEVGPPAEDDPYADIMTSIEAKGAAGAQSAWDGGRPAVLLFAASW
jgi:hypothetical protein